ncbi:MAG: beta-glucosidase, partial [Candidatus Omnitrophica bacterium]|nr:beta-glucosidase [Candidatus Omnitrophota bacterium]
QESLQAIRYFLAEHGEMLYGDFGFKDAFNLDKNWWADEYLGIDQGITVLMLENFLNQGDVWKRFMSLKPIQRWISLCDLATSARTPQDQG